MSKPKGTTKTGEARNISLNQYISESEMRLLLELCKQRKTINSKKWSRTDVIIDGLKLLQKVLVADGWRQDEKGNWIEN